jgi:hypothetical protein
MAYKIVYVEDEHPGSILYDLKDNGFEAVHGNPDTFENLIETIYGNKPDAVLFDYRLAKGAKFDAPAVAQMLRSRSVEDKKYLPLFLVSSENNISTFYEDFTSNDLFDISLAKEVFQANLSAVCLKFRDTIDAYHIIIEKKADIANVLGVSQEFYSQLDYRLLEATRDEHLKTNTHKLAHFILTSIVRPIGILIGIDVLAARLGVEIGCKGFDQLIAAFEEASYKGIYSNSYKRWWAKEIDRVWEQVLKLPNLRRLDAQSRVEHLTKVGITDLTPAEKLHFAESTSFWTICRHFNRPLDIIDGLELIQKKPLPWQEKEYISVRAAMESADKYKDLKPLEKKRYQEFKKEYEKK